MGYDSKQFELHNFRAGAATAAVNAQVKDRLFNRLTSKLFLRGCTVIAELFNHEFEIQRSVLKLALTSK